MVLALVATFISIAGIYILLSAEFVAVVQILIYSGAITIIMLFGIMLTRPDKSSEVKQGRKGEKVPFSRSRRICGCRLFRHLQP